MSERDEIAAFYDEHPYPPPVDRLDAVAEAWSDGTRRRIEHSRMWPSVADRDIESILVAGCGTAQAARVAVQYPGARVVGIEVSAASLGSTSALVEQHGLANVELHELAIEDVASLGETFDYVVCTGVLHHLEDPVVGLRSLVEVMAPEAALVLLVYATYGRTGVAMLQEYCRRLGIDPSPAEIEHLVETLCELPDAHPLDTLLRTSPDFGDVDSIADALLNPRERTYTVPELFALLDAGGVRFARWVRQAPYRPQCGSMSEVSHGSRIAALDEVDQFAAMELFRGTMVRHNLVAHRADAPLPAEPVGWDGDAWRSYVPLVPTTVVSVEDRLPPGASVALINTAQVDRDLVCFLDARQRRVFDSIDGRRSLVDIDGATPELFERLWLHDLVIIDSSAVSQRGGSFGYGP